MNHRSARTALVILPFAITSAFGCGSSEDNASSSPEAAASTGGGSTSTAAQGSGGAAAGSGGTASTSATAASSGSGGGSCVPTTCAAEGKNCGSISDGCSATLACGSCSEPETCGGGAVSNVCGSGGSALGVLAASMAPGTWAELTVSNQDPILGVGSVSGTMIHYSNSMPWNPFSGVIEIIGMDHGYPSLRHVRYDNATNQFLLVADDAGLGPAHGYDHNALNPYTGDLYHRLYSGFSGTISARKKILGAPSFVDLPGVAAADQVAIGACWWSGPFVGGGSQGSFMLFNSGNAVGGPDDGEILAYDPLADTWFYNEVGKAPNYGPGSTYHSVIEYSPIKNVAVYGGGNAAPDRLWRLGSDGSVLAMPNVPPGKEVGIQRGLLVDEPVTGNFLLLSDGELWELDPSGSGTWTEQTGTRTPPSGVGIPGPTTIVAVIASSISDYGVVAFITQPAQTGGTFYLYKHQ